MNFNEFITFARKSHEVSLDLLAKEVGDTLVKYPTHSAVIEKVLAPIESPEVIRWDILSSCLTGGWSLHVAVVVATHPSECLELLGSVSEVMDTADKGFALAVRNGLDIDDRFYKYFNFEEYWHENGGSVMEHAGYVYLVNIEEIFKIDAEL